MLSDHAGNVSRRMPPDRIGGIIAMAMGAIALFESWRLYPLRMGTLAGDHVMPGAVGSFLVLLGLGLAVRADTTAPRLSFPRGLAAVRLCSSFGVLFGYWYLMDRIGYVVSTFVVAIALFGLMSGYGWIKSLLYAVVLAASLGYLFMNLLNIPLPGGIISFG
jgi:putative tricarboxylic transport membrane protein